ncbi:hypothetical protein [Rhodoluna limnophila]|uniref:hypothetical protein n=1 Tax=Rhodoluna limnophila TaxID=232537 RepID=UPI001105ED09|nr:hypothetical protein [Rhodoluna limnophila]
MTDGQFITREQLSEAARLGKPLPGFEKTSTQAVEIIASPKVDSPAIVEPAVVEPEAVEPDEVAASQDEPAPLFEVSPNLTTDTASATIVLDKVASIDDLSGAIGETGEWLRTGAIELPQLTTNTGEFEAIQDANYTDEALAIDSISGSVSNVEPLSAAGVVGRSAKVNVVPVKLAKGQNQVYLVTTISVLMVAMGGLVLGAYMLGIFK